MWKEQGIEVDFLPPGRSASWSKPSASVRCETSRTLAELVVWTSGEADLTTFRRDLDRSDHPSVRHYEITEAETFDIAFSIGVVHHLSDPDAAVARLTRAVKPGGDVLVWLYGRENNGWIVHLFNPLRRALFSRLPLRFVHALSLPLSALLWCALRLGLPPGAYYRLIRKFSFEHLRAIVFDHMIPRIALYYTRAEAEALLRRAGLTEIQVTWVNENSWSVRGRKPAAR